MINKEAFYGILKLAGITDDKIKFKVLNSLINTRPKQLHELAELLLKVKNV
jgi:hypothetical protein